MPPHSMVMTMIGASLLWVGWFGFNAGSNLEATGTAASRDDSTPSSPPRRRAVVDVRGMAGQGQAVDARHRHRRVAGLVAVTPAAGFAGPIGAIVLGLIAGVVCLFFCSAVKNMFGYDDSLDVFGVHCIGGIIGAHRHRHSGQPGARRHRHLRLHHRQGRRIRLRRRRSIAQFKAVLMTLVWSGVGSADPAVHHQHHCRPAGHGRQGARRARPHRARRARLQHVSLQARAAGRIPGTAPRRMEAPVLATGASFFCARPPERRLPPADAIG